MVLSVMALWSDCPLSPCLPLLPPIIHLSGPSCHSSLNSDPSPRPRLGGCCHSNPGAPVDHDCWPLGSLSNHDSDNLLPSTSCLLVHEYNFERGETNGPRRLTDKWTNGWTEGQMDGRRNKRTARVPSTALEMSFVDPSTLRESPIATRRWFFWTTQHQTFRGHHPREWLWIVI